MKRQFNFSIVIEDTDTLVTHVLTDPLGNTQFTCVESSTHHEFVPPQMPIAKIKAMLGDSFEYSRKGDFKSAYETYKIRLGSDYLKRKDFLDAESHRLIQLIKDKKLGCMHLGGYLLRRGELLTIESDAIFRQVVIAIGKEEDNLTLLGSRAGYSTSDGAITPFYRRLERVSLSMEGVRRPATSTEITDEEKDFIKPFR